MKQPKRKSLQKIGIYTSYFDRFPPQLFGKYDSLGNFAVISSL